MVAKLTRRQFNAALGAGVALGGLGLPWARAATGPVVVGTWGGDYQNLLQKHIAEPLLAAKGIEVIYDTANDTTRKTKLMAEKRLPRGSMDIVALTGSGAYEMWANGTLEEIDPAKIPNLKFVQPKLKTKYSVPHIYTGRVILYNPSKVKTKPTSYADLWNPELAAAGRIGVIDIQYQTTIESAAMINGGSLSNYEPGKAKLLELKKMGVKIYPTNEAMAQALKTEECWMCIMWKARGVMWQNAGVPIEIANPKEGIVLYLSEMAIAKNAKNKDGAYEYLNMMLEPAPQQAFGKAMGYNAPGSNAAMPADLAARIGFDKATEEHFMSQDYEYLAKNDAQLQEWWNKVFKA
jgi:putative spermidine/putrescine transport system substrate-binding protein